MKIAILFKSEVRSLDPNYIAGCERVFVEEFRYLKQKHLLTNAYTAAEYKKVGAFSSKLQKIPFPHAFLDMIETSRLRKLLPLLNFLSEIYYVVWFIIKERNADILYVYQHPLVAFLFPQKTILTYQNDTTNMIWLLSHKGIYQQTIITFCSTSLKNQIANRVSLNPDNTLIIYNPVVKNGTTPFPKGPHKKIKFIYASNWNKEKGAYQLISLVKFMGDHYATKTDFFICGSIDLWSLSPQHYKKNSIITKKMKQLGETYPNVHVLGKVSHQKIQSLIKTMDFCLFPSIWKEPLGLIVLESLQHGTPVIAFNMGGPKEIITHGYNGLLVSSTTQRAYRQMVEAALHLNDKQYRDMSKNCIASVRQLSMDYRNKKLLTIFQHIYMRS
jgi:glycosyltransferase involved in cell wall biosynthesis